MTAPDRLVQKLCLTATKAAVVHDPVNLRYLTGFTGEGLAFLTDTRRTILTDARYAEQAARQAPGFEVILTAQGAPGWDRWLADTCRAGEIDVLLYEDDCVTVRQFGRLKTLMSDFAMFVPMHDAVQQLRAVKAPDEIEQIRAASRITCSAWDALLPHLAVGITEEDVRRELDHLMRQMGAEGTAFDTIAASGENGSLCHGLPDRRVLRSGDLLTLDFGARLNGYCADMTRTIALGQPDPQLKAAHSIVLETLLACEQAVRPGMTGGALDHIARDRIDSGEFAGRFTHALGHGLGLEIHELPQIGQGCRDVLVPGMVVTIEPGIYLPGVGGVRIEDTVLVTENGYEVLTNAPRELLIL